MPFRNEDFINKIVPELTPFIINSEYYCVANKLKNITFDNKRDLIEIRTPYSSLINRLSTELADTTELDDTKTRREKILAELKEDGITEASFNLVFNLTNESQITEENFENIKDTLCKIEIRYGDIFINELNISSIERKYYSAYSNDMSKDDFASKNIIWMSTSLPQALLHPFDNKQISSPVMFEFQFSKPVILMESVNLYNTKIFKFIPQFNIFRNLYRDLLISEGYLDVPSDNELFFGKNNKHILYIIEAINRIVNFQYFKIYGYFNINDQNETAVINFNDLVNRDRIKKYTYTRIIYDNDEYTLPFSTPRTFEDIGVADYNDPESFKLNCKFIDLIIYYKGEEPSDQEKMYDCKLYSRVPSTGFNFKKYLKYKQKYLQLKKMLNK